MSFGSTLVSWMLLGFCFISTEGQFNCNTPFECSNTSVVSTTSSINGNAYKSIYGNYGNGGSIMAVNDGITLRGSYSAQYSSFIMSMADSIECNGVNSVKYTFVLIYNNYISLRNCVTITII